MSSAFDVSPVPPQAEGLDIDLDPNTTTRKYDCAEGTYPAIVTKLEKVQKEGKEPRIKVEVTLTAQEVKGIKATRFYDISGEYAWLLEKAVEVFGVKKEQTGTTPDGKPMYTLPLKANYFKIVAQPCMATVKPRTYVNNAGQDRVAMDIVQLAAAPKQDTDEVPF
jgi:hypothetical protein